MFRAKAAGGAFFLGVVGLVQSLVAFTYFFMARTEMFLSPVTQSFAYWLAGLSGALILWFSPIRTMRGGLPVAGPSATGPDALADMGHGAAAGDPPEL